MSESKSKAKTGSVKLWKAISPDLPEVLWVRGKTRPEVKRHLRFFLRSKEYWEGEPQEILAREIFKSYSENLKDCPGIRIDDTRGDVLLSLTDPSKDWIDNGTGSKKKKKETV